MFSKLKVFFVFLVQDMVGVGTLCSVRGKVQSSLGTKVVFVCSNLQMVDSLLCFNVESYNLHWLYLGAAMFSGCCAGQWMG